MALDSSAFDAISPLMIAVSTRQPRDAARRIDHQRDGAPVENSRKIVWRARGYFGRRAIHFVSPARISDPTAALDDDKAAPVLHLLLRQIAVDHCRDGEPPPRSSSKLAR